jgi:hypothetical protein
MSICNGKTLSERQACKHYDKLSKNNPECRWRGFKLESGYHCGCLDAQKECRNPEIDELIAKEREENG